MIGFFFGVGCFGIGIDGVRWDDFINILFRGGLGSYCGFICSGGSRF